MANTYLVVAFLISLSAISAANQTQSFTFFSDYNTNRETAPIYLVTKETLPFVQFDVQGFCYSGAWIGYSFSNFTYSGDRYFNKDEYCYSEVFVLPNSVRRFGNASNPQQNSMTFFSEQGFIGEMSDTYYEDVPVFNGNIVSLVLTGTELFTSLSLFTLQNYAGIEYCIFMESTSSLEEVATAVYDLTYDTGLPAGAFKSFKFGNSCSAAAKLVPTL